MKVDLRIYAERIRAYERVVLRRWLAAHVTKSLSTLDMDIDQLELLVWDYGGDARKLRQHAKDEMTQRIVREVVNDD